MGLDISFLDWIFLMFPQNGGDFTVMNTMGSTSFKKKSPENKQTKGFVLNQPFGCFQK